MAEDVATVEPMFVGDKLNRQACRSTLEELDTAAHRYTMCVFNKWCFEGRSL